MQLRSQKAQSLAYTACTLDGMPVQFRETINHPNEWNLLHNTNTNTEI